MEGELMKSLIIFAHPWDGSFNNYILKTTIETLEKKGNTVDVIDLYHDEFDPAMSVSDLRVFSKGEYADQKAENYVRRLQETDEVIFIFPVWWYGMPAMLKGFFDKVLLKGTTYVEDENKQMRGILDIKKSAVFTTANITKGIFEQLGDPIERALIQGIFGMVGIENTTWIHCPTVHLEDSRQNFLNELTTYLNE